MAYIIREYGLSSAISTMLYPRRTYSKAGLGRTQLMVPMHFSYQMNTMKSLQPLTKAINMLFLIINSKLSHAYREAFKQLQPAAKIVTMTASPDDELFPL
jgi:hypothetical protein